jgi:MYXO-CTERM domain-containing protein
MDDGTLVLKGTGTWSDGQISVLGDSFFRNEGTLTITVGPTLFGTVNSTADFYNTGSLTVSGAGTLSDPSGGWGFHNSGTVTLSGGAIFEWQNTGNSNATLESGGSVTGNGILRFDEAGDSGAPNVVLTGTHTIGAGATLDLGSSSSFTGSGTITGGGTLVLDGTNVQVADTDTITFDIATSIPAIPGAGDDVVTQLATAGTGVLDFSNVTTWSGGPLEIVDGTVTSSGTWTATAAGVLQKNTSGAALQNTGTLVIAPGTGTVEVDPILTTTSALNVNSGTLLVVGNGLTQTAGTISVAALATLAANADSPPVAGKQSTVDIQGGTLTGAGTVDAIVTNEGNVVPGATHGGGTLTVTQTYTQSSTGTLGIRLVGSTPDTFAVLAVGGDATLSGTLAVSVLNNYVPSVGTSFKVITSGGADPDTGMFASMTSPPEITIETTYDANDVTLNVTALGVLDAGNPVDAGFPDTGAPPVLPEAGQDAGADSTVIPLRDAGSPPISQGDASASGDAGAGGASSSSGCSVGTKGSNPADLAFALGALVALFGVSRRRR